MSIGLDSNTEAHTLAAGRRLASLMRVGDIVLLAGELGAGKTTFVVGLAEGLGIESPVSSPSFILSRRHDDGLLPLIHADVYRLGTFGELGDLDLVEESRDGVLVVEWGQAVESHMPGDHLTVRFEVTGPSSRRLVFEGHGSWARRPLEELVA